MSAVQDEVVYWYGQLEATVRRMLVLARAMQWQDLLLLDAQCDAIVDHLRTMGSGEQVPGSQRVRVLTIIDRIRIDQEELSALVQPQLAQLARNIEDLQRAQGLNRAYVVAAGQGVS